MNKTVTPEIIAASTEGIKQAHANNLIVSMDKGTKVLENTLLRAA